jgi:hypothetical protein
MLVRNPIKKITFRPARNFIGSVVFMWNGASSGQGFSDSASTVTIFIENKSTVSKLPSALPPSFIGKGFEHFPMITKQNKINTQQEQKAKPEPQKVEENKQKQEIVKPKQEIVKPKERISRPSEPLQESNKE